MAESDSNDLRSEFGLHFFVVVNPDAGQEEADVVRKAVAAHLDVPGSSYTFYDLTGKGDLRAEIQQALAAGAQCVVAAGGDGTVSAVANVLIGQDALLGILPTGTGNSLARVLGIPLDLDAAVALLVGNASILQIDAMAVGERYAVLNVSAGVTALAQARASEQEKQLLGRAAYGLETARAMLDFAPTRFRLKVDGEEEEAEGMDLTVANGLALAALPLDWGPLERFQDRQLDGYLLSVQGPLQAGLLLAELIMDAESGLHTRQLRIREQIDVESERPVPVQVDGEVVGETPVTIRLVPEALRVLAPAREQFR